MPYELPISWVKARSNGISSSSPSACLSTASGWSLSKQVIKQVIKQVTKFACFWASHGARISCKNTPT